MAALQACRVRTGALGASGGGLPLEMQRPDQATRPPPAPARSGPGQIAAVQPWQFESWAKARKRLVASPAPSTLSHHTLARAHELRPCQRASPPRPAGSTRLSGPSMPQPWDLRESVAFAGAAGAPIPVRQQQRAANVPALATARDTSVPASVCTGVWWQHDCMSPLVFFPAKHIGVRGGPWPWAGVGSVSGDRVGRPGSGSV